MVVLNEQQETSRLLIDTINTNKELLNHQHKKQTQNIKQIEDHLSIK